MSEVGVAQLRRDLKDWLERVQSGDEVVITDRGRPIARLSSIGIGPLLDQLATEGKVSGPPRSQRPTARDARRAKASGEVAELVVKERDARR